MNAFRNLKGAVQNTVKTVVGMVLGHSYQLPKTGRLWTPKPVTMKLVMLGHVSVSAHASERDGVLS